MRSHGDELKDMETPDVQETAMKIQMAKEAYRTYLGTQEKPQKDEVWAWYLYGFCSYLIQTALLPIVFPLIISEILDFPPEPAQGWDRSEKGLVCNPNEMKLYARLIHRSISVHDVKFSPLEWTSISWAAGLVLAGPVLNFVSTHLDHGHHQQVIAGAATVIGSLVCLPVGLFKVTWIFPLYVVTIAMAATVATASHTRHHGLMVRGFTGSALERSQFQTRRWVSSWLSVYATVAGALGSAVISSFTYHMLRQNDRLMGLWIVSILSGLKWLAGVFHVLTIRPGTDTSSSSSSSTSNLHFSIFKHYHAAGSLISTFLSSFTSMCIFAGGVFYIIGHLCLKPVYLLYFWLIYFLFPSLSLPLLQPLQHLIQASAVKMKLLGFLLSLLTSGVGFYFQDKTWRNGYILFFAAVQSTSAGILHAFGRVLLLDCTPPGKEGLFSTWFSWMKAIGTCTGFAVASVVPGKVGTSFGVAFLTAVAGAVLLIFGNISDVGGAIAAGHVREVNNQRGSPVNGLDDAVVMKEANP